MGDEVHKAGVGAGVGAAASVDVQVFGSVLFNGDLHAGNFWNTPCCVLHSHSTSRSAARYFHWVFKDGAMGVKVPVAVQERRSVHALLSRENSSDPASSKLSSFFT